MGHHVTTSPGVDNKTFTLELLVAPQSIAVIKEEVLGLHVFQVEFCVFTASDDLVPQHHLVKRLTTHTSLPTGNLHV